MSFYTDLLETHQQNLMSKGLGVGNDLFDEMGLPKYPPSKNHQSERQRLEKLTEAHLRTILADPKTPCIRRTVAVNVLQSMENPNMADFEPFLTGDKTLADLQAAGIDTSVVKSVRITDGKGGRIRAIEFHDRAGREFERGADRSEGKPKTELDVTIEHVESRREELQRRAIGDPAVRERLKELANALGDNPN